MTKLSNLTKVTTVGDDALFYIVDPARSAGDRSVGMDKDDVKTLVGGGGGGAVVSKTGTTIEFTENALYNESTYLTSGDLTLDLTGALKNTYCYVYCDRYNPNLLGENIILSSGGFDVSSLNVLLFYYNGTNIYLNVLNSQYLTSPSLILSPLNESVQINWSSINDADNYIVERSLDNFVTAGIEIYNGSLLTFTDTGLTNGTTYYYRAKSQGQLFLDSELGNIVSDVPVASTNFVTNLVAAYELENNLNDYTGNNNGNATFGAITYVSGKIGQAQNMAVNGFEIPFSSDFDLGATAFSLAFWIKRVATTGTDFAMYIGTPINIAGNTSVFNINLSDGAGLLQGSVTTSNLPINTWTHYVATYDGALDLKIYINASPVGSITNTSFISLDSNSSTSSIGSNRGGGNQYGGEIDAFRLYKGRVLTQSEITEMYNIENTGTSSLP